MIIALMKTVMKNSQNISSLLIEANDIDSIWIWFAFLSRIDWKWESISFGYEHLIH